MEQRPFADRVAAVSALDEPVRRALFDHVSRSDSPVSRDEAAEALGLARSTAAFHLDRLVDEGLLAVEFKRLTGRTGPGAGRPSKLYRRAAGEVAVTVPERHYDFAGQLLLAAIEESTRTGEAVGEALLRTAGEAGRELGADGGSLEKILEEHGLRTPPRRQRRARARQLPVPSTGAAAHRDRVPPQPGPATRRRGGSGDRRHTMVLDPGVGRCCVRAVPRHRGSHGHAAPTHLIKSISSARRPAPRSSRHRPKGSQMSKLHRLYAEQGQSPWLDNLTRGYLHDGTLARMVADGIRGVTANPTIFAKAIEGSADYDEQFASLTAAGCSVEDAYWELVVADITAALAVLRPVFDAADGTDGFVSVEVAPELARDTQATVAAARELHERIDEPNLFVKIPATAEGVPAVEAMTAEGRSINITLIFSLARYAEVIEAYLAGLEAFTGRGGDPSTVHSVASFFVSRVDTEVDRRLDGCRHGRGAGSCEAGPRSPRPSSPTGCSSERFSGERWQRLADLGAHRQRPLWASTSTKNPAYPDTLYVDELIGPDTVNTLPEQTIAAFEDHGELARTLDTGVEEATEVMRRLAAVGVDMDDVGRTLEDEGVASFHESFQHMLASLAAKARQLSSR